MPENESVKLLEETKSTYRVNIWREVSGINEILVIRVVKSVDRSHKAQAIPFVIQIIQSEFKIWSRNKTEKDLIPNDWNTTINFSCLM